MGKVSPPKKVKLFCGMISSDEVIFNSVIEDLTMRFGPVDSKSSVMIFNQTDYYKKEMGENLKKFFVSFTDLIDSIFLVDVKLFTQELESKYTSDGKRMINLDPGYLSEAKMVLATTKDHQHRIYMGRGIYGEVTLKFQNKTYEPWEWTYNDYKRAEYIEYFIELRSILRKQLGRKHRDTGVSVP